MSSRAPDQPWVSSPPDLPHVLHEKELVLLCPWAPQEIWLDPNSRDLVGFFWQDPCPGVSWILRKGTRSFLRSESLLCALGWAPLCPWCHRSRARDDPWPGRQSRQELSWVCSAAGLCVALLLPKLCFCWCNHPFVSIQGKVEKRPESAGAAPSSEPSAGSKVAPKVAAKEGVPKQPNGKVSCFHTFLWGR